MKKKEHKVIPGEALPFDPEAAKRVDDPLAIDAVAYVEIFAANAKQTAYFYTRAFGFRPLAYRGPETGYRNAATYVLEQNDITLVISGPLTLSHWMAPYVMIHGDTVKDVAFRVPDVEAFYAETMMRGARSAESPTIWRDESGFVKRAAIYTYGETVHSAVERGEYKGCYWPGFVPYEDYFESIPSQTEPGLMNVDHVVGNVEEGQMEHWVKFYEDVLGFKEMIHFTDEDISTEYSALMSKVMTNGTSKIKLPINEPAEAKRKSQIEEYLEFHQGPGVQHIALRTDNIIHTVKDLRRRGVNFLRVPKAYYDEVPARVGSIKEDLAAIAGLGILADRDDDGYLLQIFTKPVHDRPTLFFEIIQREGSQGFGAGNFKALFEALEREQDLRGNL
ncbi:MAG: 4-hydroxyphenylpyruvate dioxygenase [Bdellovibrionales bacterium]|nr:4-hydroxyphenylpyruvate dioxygenase [Bdellovibrionales bacterium]